MTGNNMDQGPEEIVPIPHHGQREEILSALALVLGPDTDYARRMHATHFLTQKGPTILPLLLSLLQAHPEIMMPSWPWWPPQYEQLGRLLIQLSQQARLPLDDLLKGAQPPGPVLWTSVLEAMGYLPHEEYEPALREGLAAPWWTVRYAAASAIARRASHGPICPLTHAALQQRQVLDEQTPVRLAAACALLRCSDSGALAALLPLLEPQARTEERRAALFILATETPLSLDESRREELIRLLLLALRDADLQCAHYAARTLRYLARPDTLPALEQLLTDPHPQTVLVALTALEELATRRTLRYALQQQQLPRQITALLHQAEPDVRRQACYTLATLGGEYATATLGTLILDELHPAHLDALEALRLLPDIQRPSILARALRWLEHTLGQPTHPDQARALDSLSAIIWQAHARQHRTLLSTISTQLQQSGSFLQLLSSSSSRVRQRTIEILALLDPHHNLLRPVLFEMLHHDIDRQVRISLAKTFGQAGLPEALPDLLLALLDPDEGVAEEALIALLRISNATHPVIYHALQEIAVYQVPLWRLQQRRHLAHAARMRLKQADRLGHTRPLAT